MTEHEAAAAGELLAGRYRLQRLRARGDAGHVYDANDQLLDRLVVVKVLDALPGGPAVTRALRAARLAARALDSHLVRVLEVVDGPPALVVLKHYDAEALGGEALEPGSPAALTLADDVLAGLAALHRAGAAHRDVRAHNVLVTVSGRTLLTTAGLAEAALDAGLDAADGAAADARTDVAAAGVLLRALLGVVTPAVGAVLDRAVQVEPASRYPNATTLRAALHAARRPGTSSIPSRKGVASRAEATVAAAFQPAAGAGLPAQGPRGTVQDPAASAPAPDPPGERHSDASPTARAAPAAADTGSSVPQAGRRRRAWAAVAGVGVAALVAGVAIELVRSAPPTTTLAAAPGLSPSGLPAASDPPPAVPAVVPSAVPPPTLAPEPSAPEPSADASATPTADPFLTLVAAGGQLATTDGDAELLSSIERIARRQDGARAAEAAQLLGEVITGTASGELSRPFAGEAFNALAPEVDIAALLALVERDPESAGPDAADIARQLRGLDAIAGPDRAVALSSIYGLATTGAVTGRLTPEFGAAVGAVLRPQVTREGLLGLLEQGDRSAGVDSFAERLAALGTLAPPDQAREAADLFGRAAAGTSGLTRAQAAVTTAVLLPDLTLDGVVALARAEAPEAALARELELLGDEADPDRAAELLASTEDDVASGELPAHVGAAALQLLRGAAAAV